MCEHENFKVTKNKKPEYIYNEATRETYEYTLHECHCPDCGVTFWTDDTEQVPVIVRG